MHWDKMTSTRGITKPTFIFEDEILDASVSSLVPRVGTVNFDMAILFDHPVQKFELLLAIKVHEYIVLIVSLLDGRNAWEKTNLYYK